MKALFVCLTDYQLLNSINIKKHLLTEQEADIIIFNNKIGTFELADRLQQTGIFQNVYVYSDYFKGLHKYLRCLSEHKRDITCIGAIKGSLKNISLKILQNIKSKEWVINKKIYKNKKIDFKQYDQFFGIGTKAFVGNCLNTILKYNKCTNNIIDEGLATYLSYDWSENCKVDSVYLYEPDLAIYKDKYNNFIKIPKIKKNDKEFINIINFIFDFKDINKINLIDKVVFFDQNTDPMPKYLRNAGSIKKFIFANPYRKHLKEQMVYQTKIELFKILSEKYWPTRVFVKLHPRSNSDYIKDYKDNKAEFFPNIFAPWEVFGCNYEIKNNVWVTLYSSALCAYDFTIENNDNNKYIFLYRILNKYQKMGKFKEVDNFFGGLNDANNQKVFLPNDIEEFQNIIEDLKGEKDESEFDKK